MRRVKIRRRPYGPRSPQTSRLRARRWEGYCRGRWLNYYITTVWNTARRWQRNEGWFTRGSCRLAGVIPATAMRIAFTPGRKSETGARHARFSSYIALRYLYTVGRIITTKTGASARTTNLISRTNTRRRWKKVIDGGTERSVGTYYGVYYWRIDARGIIYERLCKVRGRGDGVNGVKRFLRILNRTWFLQQLS